MLTLLRWLADSNRRKRFCRPVTKPLIQTTVGGIPCRIQVQNYNIFLYLQMF